MIGRMARRIDTAPRRPTHDTNATSCRVKRNGSRHSHTASGRATKVRNAASATAPASTAGNWVGVASRPRVRNMAIWLSQVVPGLEAPAAPAAWRMRTLPATTPAT